MKSKTRWKQIGRAYKLRKSDLICIAKRDENGWLHLTVVEPEYVEATLRFWGDGAFIFDWFDWLDKPKEG